MSSQTVSLESLSPAERAQLDCPVRIWEPAPLTTRYQIQLAYIGLDKLAQRDADTASSIRWLKVDSSDTWKTRAKSAMARTEPGHADTLAMRRELQFKCYADVFPSPSLTRMDVYFGATPTRPGDPAETIIAAMAEDQRNYRRVRKLVKRVLPKAIDNLVTTDSAQWGLRVKVLYPGKLTHDQAIRIRDGLRDLGERFAFRYHAFDRTVFRTELHTWAAADLPTTEYSRANHELRLKGIQQIAAHVMSKDERSKFASSTTPLANSHGGTAEDAVLRQERRIPTPPPKSPKTGRPALYMSPIVDISTPVEDILDSEWIPIPQRR